MIVLLQHQTMPCAFFIAYPLLTFCKQNRMKIKNVIELFSLLPENERIIVDVLRQIICEVLPVYCREKISYNVPFFYGNKSICIIWPSTIPRGGIKEGVLLGFWYGNRLKDADHFLTHGTNKKVFLQNIFNAGGNRRTAHQKNCCWKL